MMSFRQQAARLSVALKRLTNSRIPMFKKQGHIFSAYLAPAYVSRNANISASNNASTGTSATPA